MDHEKSKFLMELGNYFEKFKDYSVGEIFYSVMNQVGEKSDLLYISNADMINSLEKSQIVESGK